MMEQITFVKIEIRHRETKTEILGTLSNGKQTTLGDVKTDSGAKRMLAKRAKQFGLTVNGEVAA